MKTIIKLALVAVIFITYSCDKESATLSDELTPVALKGGVAVERPVSISLSGMSDPDGGLDTYTGKMTHLGKIYGTVGRANFGPHPTIPGAFLNSTIGQCDAEEPELVLDVINAANGDKVFSRGELIFVPTNAEFTEATYSGVITFCGGTGRFEGASGSMQIADGVFFITADGIGKFSHTGNGSIIY